MIKKIFVFLLLLTSPLLDSYADWRSDVSSFFGNNKDYQGAISYLLSYIEENDKVYNPVACGLLAYSFSWLNNKDNEYKWLAEYFENYRGGDSIFDFLDYPTYEEVFMYLGKWKRKYPLVTELALIDSEMYKGPSPPSKFIISVDIENNAYYKLSEQKKAVKGGLLKKGFNLINIKAEQLFEKSASHVFFLDLKTGDMIVRKEIELDIKLDSPQVIQKPAVKIKESEYKLSMFVGDKLIVSSQKKLSKSFSMKVKNPPWPENRKPFEPVNVTNPFMNSVSIFSAIGAIAQLIKDWKKGKEDQYRVKPVKKARFVSATFIRRDSDGISQEIKALITLRTRHLKVSSF